jgi:hypothetical protein
MRIYERMDGPMIDKRLAKSAGVARRRVGPEIELLVATSAAGLTAIDIVYLTKGRISPIYLLDAAEFALTSGGCPPTPRARMRRVRTLPARRFPLTSRST